jgi:hypothetical protein
VLKALLAIRKDVVAEISSGDELSKKIYASYQQFRASIMDWSDVAERAYLNSRGARLVNYIRSAGARRSPPFMRSVRYRIST